MSKSALQDDENLLLLKPVQMHALKFFFFLAGVHLLHAASAPISENEALNFPKPQRISAIVAIAQREGWTRQAAPLREAAHTAYRQDKTAIADAWFNLYRWTSIWGLEEAQYVPGWMAAVKTAQAAHPNMPPIYPSRRVSLGSRLQPELQLWLLTNNRFARDFFSLISPVDYLPGVFQILDELHFRNPARFESHANLALAIAMVYDVPPPPRWPHGQVRDTALERKLPKPLDAFVWWTRQEQLGLTHHPLGRLGANELKFLVDVTAPFAELEWSQQVFDYPLNSLGRAYSIVRYDADRVQRDDLTWSGETYSLDDILAAGGICADQAYFASQIGKARGVPTLLFRGQGTGSRHAWFGFLDSKGAWQMDVGRYAEQRYVTGYALDPQTWREISDHELKFLAERFLTQPAYQESRVHSHFAADFLTREPDKAIAAARKAIQLEPRNITAWEILVKAEKDLRRDALKQEATLREAALAFEAYPDLASAYSMRLAESMRNRGDIAAAELEQSRMAQRNQENRHDINLRVARAALVQTFTKSSLPEKISTYETLVASQGQGAGIAFFDQIVVVFVEHLLLLQETASAAAAMETARHALKLDSNTQLGRDFERLSQRVKAGG